MDLIEHYNLNDPPCNSKLSKFELILSTLVINILSLALPIMVLQVYDRVMIEKNIHTLIVLALGVTGCIFLEAILRIARAYMTGFSGMLYEYTMSANAMKRYINSDPTKIKSEGIGEQIQNLDAFSKLRAFYGGQALITLIDIPFAFIFLFFIYSLTGILVLVPLVLITVFILLTWFLGNKLLATLKTQDQIDDKRYNFIIETLQGIHSVKSYGVEAIFKRRYENLEEDSSLITYESSLLSTGGFLLAAIFNELIVISVVSFGAPLAINHYLTTGALITTVLLSGRLMQPIQRALLFWTQYQDYRISKEKAEDMFSIVQIPRDKGIVDIEKQGLIEIKNLCFNYDERELFDNINLTVEKNQIIAIHGPDTLGKTMLMKLIAGINIPSKGQIIVDDVEVSKYESEELVKHVGYISSENIMLQGTIMNNLTAFDEQKELQAMELVRLLGIDKEVELLSRGYETIVNDGLADSIAPGVKQRISIVRSLLNKPKIILFKNADKGLDKSGYNLLIKLLSMLKGKVTMIIVTEDLNITKLADKNYNLENGVLEEISVNDSSIFEIKPYRELKI